LQDMERRKEDSKKLYKEKRNDINRKGNKLKA
jgi:hypothetical protein